MADEEQRRFIVWGDNALALRLVNELMGSYGAPVTVIVPSLTDGQAADIEALRPDPDDPELRPEMIEAKRLTEEVFRQAGLPGAAALALVAHDDFSNVDAALIAREVDQKVRIVLRMFNPVLSAGVKASLGDCDVLSASEIAAPAFVTGALGAAAPAYIRLRDQLLLAGHRSDFADPHDVVCGLAVTQNHHVPAITLPADESAADIVLARVYGNRETPRRPHRQHHHPLRAARLAFNRNVRRVIISVAVLLALGTVALTAIQRVNVWQALYLTLITALGGANADLTVSTSEQIVEVCLVVAGIAVIPALTAAVVEALVKTRLAIAAGGLTEPVSDHVVVVGLGNVGTRVIQELHALGVDVVAIERSENARGVQIARAMGIPVLIRNANTPEALRAASVQTSRALMVLATDDMVNLETALIARTVYSQANDAQVLRVVLRLFDEGFANRINRAFHITISRSVSYLSAPAFAAAMMGREVIDTIPVGRRVLLVAEIPVGAGSQIEGRYAPDLNRPHEVRLIAIRTGRDRQTFWSLPARRELRRTDTLLVVATRAGLATLSEQAAEVSDPPPLVDQAPFPLLTQKPAGTQDRPPKTTNSKTTDSGTANSGTADSGTAGPEATSSEAAVSEAADSGMTGPEAAGSDSPLRAVP